MDTSSNIITFLTKYIYCLLERTRKEKNGLKIGFDWIIYNLALSYGWLPVRLPFFRRFDEEASKTKSEPEFGIDSSFLTSDKTQLIIFVLKDEELNNTNWVNEKFDSDLVMATSPNLNDPLLNNVISVKVILAYNKDEDSTGIELYNRKVHQLGTKIGDVVTLSHDRWNLSRLVDEISSNLLTPDLLPQHLSNQFSYICSQASDFEFCSSQWINQLTPNWKQFLSEALSNPIDERKIRLVTVALIVMLGFKKESPSATPGWIDLAEWAMLELFKHYGTQKPSLQNIIIDIWLNLYVDTLEQYFVENENTLISEHGLTSNRVDYSLAAINDAHFTFWNIGRIGILTLAPQEFIKNDKSEDLAAMRDHVMRSANWFIKSMNKNPSFFRPLVDSNHIELFIVWRVLLQIQEIKGIVLWLSYLENCLFVRRIKNIHVPFIESRDRMDLIAEYTITSERPSQYSDKSSYLLLMILELCFSLDDNQRDELLIRYFGRIIKGLADEGGSLVEYEIDLSGWIPPEDWGKRILYEPVTDGIGIDTGNFHSLPADTSTLSDRILKYVKATNERSVSVISKDIPRTVTLLACLKHRSPLPPEFWREIIFKNHLGQS